MSSVVREERKAVGKAPAGLREGQSMLSVRVRVWRVSAMVVLAGCGSAGPTRRGAENSDTHPPAADSLAREGPLEPTSDHGPDSPRTPLGTLEVSDESDSSADSFRGPDGIPDAHRVPDELGWQFEYAAEGFPAHEADRVRAFDSVGLDLDGAGAGQLDGDGECIGCLAGFVCVEGKCCKPDCQLSECGDDGCGGSCGECHDPYECTQDLCNEGACVFQVSPGFCAIWPDGCVYEGEHPPGDGCSTCQPLVSQESFSPVPDGAMCWPYGLETPPGKCDGGSCCGAWIGCVDVECPCGKYYCAATTTCEDPYDGLGMFEFCKDYCGAFCCNDDSDCAAFGPAFANWSCVVVPEDANDPWAMGRCLAPADPPYCWEDSDCPVNQTCAGAVVNHPCWATIGQWPGSCLP